MEKPYPLKKSIALFIAVFHIGALAALFFPTTNRAILALTVWSVTSSLGIGVGYHRLLTHRGFQTFRFVEYTLAIIAALAQQGLAITWVAIHRVHHRYTEQPGLDPHTPREGRFWSHMDWMLHPDSTLKSRADLRKWAPDLMRQRFYRLQFIQWLPTVLLGVLCLIIGGIPAVLWGVALPVVVGWHQTWLVNSATHIWGSRRFQTPDDSRNLWWVALITWGEGWHNNHHHDPVNPRHGLTPYQIDVNWYIIRAMQLVRLAR